MPDDGDRLARSRKIRRHQKGSLAEAGPWCESRDLPPTQRKPDVTPEDAPFARLAAIEQ